MTEAELIDELARMTPRQREAVNLIAKAAAALAISDTLDQTPITADRAMSDAMAGAICDAQVDPARFYPGLATRTDA